MHAVYLRHGAVVVIIIIIIINAKVGPCGPTLEPRVCGARHGTMSGTRGARPGSMELFGTSGANKYGPPAECHGDRGMEPNDDHDDDEQDEDEQAPRIHGPSGRGKPRRGPTKLYY